MRYLFALGLALMLTRLVNGGDLEEGLRLFLAKSDLVALGEVTTEPVVKPANAGFRNYQADFKITQVIKWDAPGETRVGETIKVHILLEGAERLPEINKGGKCLLFLECHDLGPNPSYITADFYFGVQRPNQGLANALSRIVTEQRKTPLSVPAEKDIELFYPDLVRPGGLASLTFLDGRKLYLAGQQ